MKRLVPLPSTRALVLGTVLLGTLPLVSCQSTPDPATALESENPINDDEVLDEEDNLVANDATGNTALANNGGAVPGGGNGAVAGNGMAGNPSASGNFGADPGMNGMNPALNGGNLGTNPALNGGNLGSNPAMNGGNLGSNPAMNGLGGGGNGLGNENALGQLPENGGGLNGPDTLFDDGSGNMSAGGANGTAPGGNAAMGGVPPLAGNAPPPVPDNAIPNITAPSQAVEPAVPGSNGQAALPVPSAQNEVIPEEGNETAASPRRPPYGIRPPTPEELEEAKKAIAKLKDLAPGQGPEEYIVQHGDTLWDISDQLLDDPYYWPKLWSYNPAIENPNLIYPGMRLVFMPSNGSEPPALAVRDTEDAILPIGNDMESALRTNNPLADSWRGKEGTLIDPSELPIDKSVESVGESFPGTAYLYRVPGFVALETPEALGEIDDLANSPLIYGPGGATYATFLSPPRPGERFLTLRRNEDIMNPEGDFADSELYVYTGVVGVSKVGPDGRVTLVVESSTQGVSAGDLIVPFRNLFHKVDPASPGRPASIRSEVIAVLDGALSVAGLSQTVYLRPETQVNPGDVVELFMPPGGTALFDSEGLEGIPVAKAQVIEVEKDSVVAVVTRATREVSVGARTYPEF